MMIVADTQFITNRSIIIRPMAALCNRAGHYIFALWFVSSFFFYSSPNLSGRRLDVYPTSFVGLYSQLRHISTIGKKLLNSNIFPICPYNVVNFGLLAAEIVSLVWGTPS